MTIKHLIIGLFIVAAIVAYAFLVNWVLYD